MLGFTWASAWPERIGFPYLLIQGNHFKKRLFNLNLYQIRLFHGYKHWLCLETALRLPITTQIFTQRNDFSIKFNLTNSPFYKYHPPGARYGI
jgi:hypothetical protein